MPTYPYNCFELVREVREGLNEFNDALATGDDTSGAYRNDNVIKHINRAIQELFAMIARRRGHEFTKEATVTPVNSVITPPADFGKLVLLKDAYGNRVYSIDEVERHRTAQYGSQRLYYQRGRLLNIDQGGVTAPYSLVYKTRPRNIHMGKASAGTTNSITLDAKHAPKIADFYIGMVLECFSGDWSSAISAYTSGRAATIVGTGASGDSYALVPEIPEWAHPLIAPKAIINLKSSPISKEPPSKYEISSYQDQILSLFREHCTPENDDVDWEEMFTSYEPKAGGIIF
jgi:hypothetical protein